MRRKNMIALLLALLMLLGGVEAAAVEPAGENPARSWFYDQLTEQGQSIYNVLLDAFKDGKMNDGKGSIDLIEAGAVNASAVQKYLDGDRTLFNDFAAAKDAFDLEHPEAWFIDSSGLSFRVTKEPNGTLHASIGPGREDDYYVAGVAGAADAAAKTDALTDAIGKIVSGAASSGTDYEKVKFVHNKITRGISYRFEQDCARDGQGNIPNAGFIRTAYALVTHEGVCEGYARSFQMAMNALDIPCVLIHGMQTSGTPEDHMWTAVWLTGPSTADGAWYAVDPTWDDPVRLDSENKVVTTGENGLDGGERETYLCVGQDVIGADWRPSGHVSTGTMEFTYPEIAQNAYGRSVQEQDGLEIVSAFSEMEGVPSTVYHVSFQGMGLREAAKKNYYFLVKMYDLNADGSMDGFDNWYYSAHGLFVQEGKYFYDTADYLVYDLSNCEYAEFAVTTKAPPEWNSPADLLDPDKDGWYKGNYSDIIAESGLIYNENGGYEQPPYVKNVSPAFTAPVSAGKTYNVHIEFTDALYRPDQSSVEGAVAGKVNDAKTAMGEPVGVDYRGFTYSWGMNGRKEHTFSNKPAPEAIRWTCGTHGTHGGTDGMDAACRITALDYAFTSSRMWADDSIRHEFFVTGLVGLKSNKYPCAWSYVFHNDYPFTTCPLCSPFRWNMWGQPQALNNPDELDLSQLTVQGVDGVKEKLDALTASMNLDPYDMNGRLMLVVENLGNDRSSAEELAGAIADSANVNIPDGAVRGSSLFEIDFARICAKTIIESKQSVRVCLGFPEGFDASMAGIVFKAYHFTRNDEGEIISVEEIPCTVTPYGLVVECMSFSPFEIVALDANMVPGLKDTSRPLMLMIEGHGSVTVNGKAAGSVVSFQPGERRTFTIEADPGYAVDTVSFSDKTKSIAPGAGTVTLSYDDLAGTGAILSVSFAAESVKDAEADKKLTAVAPAPCVHERITYAGGKDAACEQEGHTPTATCEVCHTVLSVGGPIPATGHKFENGVCAVCGKKAESGSEPSPEPGPSPAPSPSPSPRPGAGAVSSGGSGSASAGADSGVGRPATSGSSTTVGVAVTAAATSGTTASVTVDNSALNRAVNSAVAEASRQGAAPVVEVTVNTPSTADSLNVSLPTASLRTLAKAANSSLAVSSGVAGVALDHVALGALTSRVSGSAVTLKVAPVAAAALNDAQRASIGGGSVVDVSLFSGDAAIHDFGSGTITVSLPYAPGPGERGSGVAVYSMDDYGRLTPCAASFADGRVTFATGHLSMYVIVAGAQDGGGAFVDVGADAYYAAAVAWALEEGVTRGTDDAHFSPMNGCTRAQFVTFLWRAAGSPAPAGRANPFSDVSVAGYADYYDAILWAAQQGIALGTGDGTAFSPDALVLRAQAVTFMHRYARQAGIAPRSGVPAFSDVSNTGALAPYYDAIGWAAANGVTNGNGGADTFGPMETCNRGMMITFLYRLCTGA